MFLSSPKNCKIKKIIYKKGYVKKTVHIFKKTEKLEREKKDGHRETACAFYWNSGERKGEMRKEGMLGIERVKREGVDDLRGARLRT